MALSSRDHVLFWSVALGVFVLDRLTKYLVIHSLEVGQSLPLFPFFQISHVRNTGTFFGLLPHAQLFFILFALAVIIFLAVRYHTFEPRARLVFAFILGGALGNLTDRLLFGSVIDFLDFRIWPAFNLADAAVSLSVILLILFEFKRKA
jgi:signal peptidase II